VTNVILLENEEVDDMQHDLIHCDPGIMLGKPVIKGSRITVECILERLSCGETVEDVLVAYPHITREAVMASLAFAAGALHADVTYPVGI
jgi:uncharacterized protein (DUF433 family)